MKSLLYTLCVTVFLTACSSNKGGGSDIVIPESPSNLAGIAVSPTEVNLTWTDGSSNEDGFKIERKSGSGDFAEIGTVGVSVTSFSNVGLIPNQAYTYRVIAYNSAGKSRNYTNTITVTPNNLPAISTKPTSEVSFNYVLSGGNLFGDGGSPITAKGICWNQTGNPTIALPTKTVDGNGPGSYTSFVSGLIPGTLYYARAYATNANGTSYGEEIQFTAEVIDTVRICNKLWMRKNLAVTRYRNGDPLVRMGDDPNWNLSSYTSGSCGTFNNDLVNFGGIYGKIYNWFAVVDPRGIAPEGWRPATKEDYDELRTCLGPFGVGNKLKMPGTTYWLSPNSGANNSSGFSAVAGGIRYATLGHFSPPYEFGSFWTTTIVGGNGYYNYLYYDDGDLIGNNTLAKQTFMSVRCVKE